MISFVVIKKKYLSIIGATALSECPEKCVNNNFILKTVIAFDEKNNNILFTDDPTNFLP